MQPLRPLDSNMTDPQGLSATTGRRFCGGFTVAIELLQIS